jgi:hypothetical protein
MLLGLPLAGVRLAGLPLQRYLEFPPATRFLAPAAFSWPAFGVTGLLILALALPVAGRLLRSGRAAAGPPRPFPAWGWLGVAGGVLCWLLAWTRFHWFAAAQPHTFTPLWLCYIVGVNALACRRRGTCLLVHRPGVLLALFPLSAAFWWIFEYLNRFVQNWHYSGPTYGALGYALLASISFSTVLPAVASTQHWVAGWPRLRHAFAAGPAIGLARPDAAAWLGLMAAAAGLLAIGLAPDLLFALLWLAPLLALVCLQHLMGQRHIFSEASRGDWVRVVSSALAALICGVFWEMWNYFSLARWEYRVPLVHRFQLFEMPLLGYGGYLPFGLECMALVSALESAMAGRRRAAAAIHP